MGQCARGLSWPLWCLTWWPLVLLSGVKPIPECLVGLLVVGRTEGLCLSAPASVEVAYAMCGGVRRFCTVRMWLGRPVSWDTLISKLLEALVRTEH